MSSPWAICSTLVPKDVLAHVMDLDHPTRALKAGGGLKSQKRKNVLRELAALTGDASQEILPPIVRCVYPSKRRSKWCLCPRKGLLSLSFFLFFFQYVSFTHGGTDLCCM
jgi:hypothetical protein